MSITHKIRVFISQSRSLKLESDIKPFFRFNTSTFDKIMNFEELTLDQFSYNLNSWKSATLRVKNDISYVDNINYVKVLIGSKELYYFPINPKHKNQLTIEYELVLDTWTSYINYIEFNKRIFIDRMLVKRTDSELLAYSLIDDPMISSDNFKLPSDKLKLTSENEISENFNLYRYGLFIPTNSIKDTILAKPTASNGGSYLIKGNLGGTLQDWNHYWIDSEVASPVNMKTISSINNLVYDVDRIVLLGTSCRESGGDASIRYCDIWDATIEFKNGNYNVIKGIKYEKDVSDNESYIIATESNNRDIYDVVLREFNNKNVNQINYLESNNIVPANIIIPDNTSDEPMMKSSYIQEVHITSWTGDKAILKPELVLNSLSDNKVMVDFIDTINVGDLSSYIKVNTGVVGKDVGNVSNISIKNSYKINHIVDSEEQWLTQNQNRYYQSQINVGVNAGVNSIASIAGILGGVLSANPGAILGSSANMLGGFGRAFTSYGNIMAARNDLKYQLNPMTSEGNEFYSRYAKIKDSKFAGNFNSLGYLIQLYSVNDTLKEWYKNFWALYGYYLNRYVNVGSDMLELEARDEFNYIKTKNSYQNIVSKIDVPNQAKVEISAMLDKGVYTKRIEKSLYSEHNWNDLSMVNREKRG